MLSADPLIVTSTTVQGQRLPPVDDMDQHCVQSNDGGLNEHLLGIIEIKCERVVP